MELTMNQAGKNFQLSKAPIAKAGTAVADGG
jgi:hypothetical protein